MILLAWFDHLEESFSYKEVQFKYFYPPMKTSCPPAQNVNKTPAEHRRPGDAGGSPGKSSLFFLTGFHPEIRLSGDRV